ncbi:MAG: peptidylprolyl isomerase [Ruthenibacterium sp.]
MHVKRLARICLCMAVCALLTGCGGKGPDKKKPERNINKNSGEAQFSPLAQGDPIAIIDTDRGEIRIRLFPQYAPMAVQNFTGLAQQGYFNGVSFHRIVKDFVIQSGDASGTGTGGTTVWNGNAYPVEISDAMHHYTGAVGIAHVTGESAGNASQFYVVQTPKNSVDKTAADTLTSLGMRKEVVEAYRSIGGAPYLDNLYTVFAQVYEGMEVVDAIGTVKCTESGQPVEPVLIKSVTIATYTVPETAAAASDSSSAKAADADASPAASPASADSAA